MKKGRNWVLRYLPVFVLAFASLTNNSYAQENVFQNNDNGIYNNNDEALIQPEQDVNYSTFHDELSPYGNWMNYPGYGNVWVCNVAGFRPYYSDGHWAYSRYGWTWVSDYNWGWAPFHYGRWAFDNSYGWLWVPGYTWGPAWVSWRTGDNYYGWAPLSPGLHVGVNIGRGIPANNWAFLPQQYMGYNSLHPYYANRQQNVTIIRNTTIINNTSVYNHNRYYAGPERRDVERRTGRTIQQQDIYVSNDRNGSRVDGNGIHMYSPVAASNANTTRRQGAVVNRRNNTVENTQNNVRQQPVKRQPMQKAGLQQDILEQDDNRNMPATIDQRRQVSRENRQPEMQPRDRENNNPLQSEVQRQRNVQTDMQQQLDEQRRQQADIVRQQQLNDRRLQMQQQQAEERTRQMEQMRQQQMEANRQQQLEQRRFQMQQQNEARRQQLEQMRQRQTDERNRQPAFQNNQAPVQQRQQVFPQRSDNSNRTVPPRVIRKPS